MTTTPPTTYFADWTPSTRLWCYVASRDLDPKEAAFAKTYLDDFTRGWGSHGRDLAARSTVLYDRVLVLGVDQAMAGASGCSIDASVRAVRELGQRLDVDFFDRMTFLVPDGEGGVHAYSREDFAEAYARGDLDDATPVVDTLVADVAAARLAFVKPLGRSWHARMV